MPFSCIDTGIVKSEFVTRTQFLRVNIKVISKNAKNDETILILI